MKPSTLLAFLAATLSSAAIAGPASSPAPAHQMPGHPSPASAAAMMHLQSVPDSQLSRSGKVLQTIDASQYTYIEVSMGKEALWLAAPQTKLAKGDTIKFDDGAVMNNFYSKVLQRTFASVMFVNRVLKVK